MVTVPPVQLVSAADERYVPHLAAMLHSLFQHTPGATVAFHFLHRPGLDAGVVAPLAELCRRHGASLSARAVEHERVAQFASDGRYPAEAWYRVLLTSLFPELDRVLWIDADTLVLDAVTPLWEVDLAGNVLAAVPNALAPHHREHPRALGMAPGPWRYFNTGVMVLDLQRLRAIDAEGRMHQAAHSVQSRMHFADQDVFNPVLAGECRALPLCWNVTAGAFIYARENLRVHGWREYRRALRRPKIVHFTLHKPWIYGSAHPYRDRYLQHRGAAGWPAPIYAERPWKDAIGRRLPLAVRAMLSAPRRVGIVDLAALAAVWVGPRGTQ